MKTISLSVKFVAVKFFLFIFLIITFYVLTSCDQLNNLVNPTNDAENGDTLWSYTLDDNFNFSRSTPLALADDGTIFFIAGGVDYGPIKLFALDKDNGSLKWKTGDLETWHTNSNIMIGDKGNIYVTSGYHLYSINPANGEINWAWEVPQQLTDENGNDIYTYGEIGPIALANDGSILLATAGSGSYSRELYKIDISGNILWYRHLYLTTAGTQMTVGKDGTIYKIDYFTGDDFYSLIAINPGNGELEWSVKANHNSSAFEYIVITDDGNIITSIENNVLGMINASTHEVVWQKELGGMKCLIYYNNKMFIYDQYSGTSILNIKTGEIESSSLSLPQQPLIDTKGRLYGIISDWHPHLTVSTSDENIIWESKLEYDKNSLTLSYDNAIYMTSGNKVFALRCEGIQANAGWPRLTHDIRNTCNVTKW